MRVKADNECRDGRPLPSMGAVDPAPARWRDPCVHSECTYHQLSPYIGKLKSTIAKDIVAEFTRAGDLVVDPFCGSGTIPLECLLAGRRVVAADASPYAEVLTRAKLQAPPNFADALDRVGELLAAAGQTRKPDLRSVPMWVREFFHPDTLRECIAFAHVCRARREYFIFACFLGILHHQRPGFLSYPSSHLVPYLRCRKFPRKLFPEMYEYRPLRPRLVSKIERAYSRAAAPPTREGESRPVFHLSKIEDLVLPKGVAGIVTSPPYMNALDYGRDNRLRLWFVDPLFRRDLDRENTGTLAGFQTAISALVAKADRALSKGKYLVLVVGESVRRKNGAHPSHEVCQIVEDSGSRFILDLVVGDIIPDVRRARRDCRSVKREFVLVYRKR